MTFLILLDLQFILMVEILPLPLDSFGLRMNYFINKPICDKHGIS